MAARRWSHVLLERSLQNSKKPQVPCWGAILAAATAPLALTLRLPPAAQAATNAAVAGSVNGVKKGVLMGSNLTINSIGSQTIISNTIFGSNNPTNITASQSASNSGSVSNTGTVNAQ